MDKKFKIGLALSGGGYRAAAFHLGVFRKLNELKILSEVDVISCISGGSIIGTYYALNKGNFENFEKSFVQKLQTSCIKKIIFNFRFLLPAVGVVAYLAIILLDPFHWQISRIFVFIMVVILLTILFILQFKIFPLTTLKIKAYQKVFYGNAKISDLPSKPLLAINATNLSTGTLFTFSRSKCSDSSYEFIKDGGKSVTFNCSKMPVAVAVAASTSVPVPFNPVRIHKKYYENPNDWFRVNPQLIDGGLYDNQGIHKLTQENSSYACDIIIVSDGSQPFSTLFKSNNTGLLLYRGLDVMMRKIKNLQFIRDVYSKKRELAYFSLDWKYKLCIIEFIRAAKKGQVTQSVLDFHELDDEKLQLSQDLLCEYIEKKIKFETLIKEGLTESEILEVSKISTNLTALSFSQIDLLSRHGQTLTEVLVNLYCPTLAKYLNHEYN